MSEEVLDRVAHTKERVRDVCVDAYQYAKFLAEAGKRVHVVVKEWEDDKTIKQRGFYHGVVLTEIAEQVQVEVDGKLIRYTMQVWKEYMRALFLGDRWELVAVPGKKRKKRKKRRKVRVSTEGLGIRAYSRLIDKVMAHAASEWGVTFSLDNWEDWRPR